VSSAPLWRIAGPPALAVAVVLLATAGRHGLHGDELYFRMLPLAWWYDDQPPLTIWLTRLAASTSDAVWVQRIPAVVAAAAGSVLAALFPRLLGYGPGVQAVAAWAHAFTVYPLIHGHVFLTSTLDLLAWLLVILLVVAAILRRPHALAWAGVVAGLACWNKLLVLVLVAALGVGLLVADRALLRSRDAAAGAVALVGLGGPQVLAQALHGWPMSAVSGGLVEVQGSANRWLVVPVLLALVGPPFALVWTRGLAWRGRRQSGVPVLAVAALVLVAWNLAVPAQPYYAVALVLAALALGWGPQRDAGTRLWRRVRTVLAANAAVSVVVALPVLPPGTAVFDALAAINPVLRDQTGWPDYVRQVATAAAADAGERTVLTSSYALAGAVAFYGPAVGLTRVASGHNALWSLGPPGTERVLLAGPVAISHAHLFARCEPAGELRPGGSDAFGLGGSPMARCDDPVGGWAAVWPLFRRLG